MKPIVALAVLLALASPAMAQTIQSTNLGPPESDGPNLIAPIQEPKCDPNEKAVFVLSYDGSDYNSTFTKNERRNDANQAEDSDECPYRCDPVKAFGGPQLSRPYFALSGLMLFFAAMYFSDKGLERHPFGWQHIVGWLLSVVIGGVTILAVIPMLLRVVWPWM